MNDYFSQIKSGEERRQELFQALKKASSSPDTINRIVFFAEILHVLSGNMATENTSVDESTQGIILSTNDRNAILTEIKRLAPKRNRNKDAFTDNAAIIQQLLFESLKIFSTDTGATDLLNQILAKENKRPIENAYITARNNRIKRELHLFYSYASHLLTAESLTNQTPQLARIFEKNHKAFTQRANLFVKNNAFYSIHAQDYWEEIDDCLKELSDVIALYTQFKPTLLNLCNDIITLQLEKFPLKASSLQKSTLTNYLKESITITRGQADALMDEFRNKGYINDLDILQPSYYQAIEKRVPVFQEFPAFSRFQRELLQKIDEISTKQKPYYSFDDLLKFLSTILPDPSCSQCLYLLITILYTEQHLLSLFPNSYSEIHKTGICSSKIPHFFLFLYLYFTRLSNKPDNLTDELFLDCLATVLKSEYSSDLLNDGLYSLKESIAVHHIKKTYATDLRNSETIRILGERLKLYSNGIIKVNGIIQPFNQEELSDLLGYTQQAISKILSGQKKFFSPSLLMKISKRTGLGILYLLGKADEPGAIPSGVTRVVFKHPKTDKLLE